jgi:DNA repair photolyase
LGFGAGTDFDTKLVAKVNAPELLDAALSKRGWSGEAVHFSGATDCYQPLEAVYHLTRRCLEVCLARRNSAAIVTKSFLVARDAELIAELGRVAGGQVCVSVPAADAKISKAMEPQAPPPSRRLAAIRRLAGAGVSVGVLVAPIIPGLNDRDIPRVLQQAREAGATQASLVPLRLPGNVEAVFLARLHRELPLHARRVEQRLRDIRGGQLDDSRFGHRMTGAGPYWDSIQRLFEVWRNRLEYHNAADCSSLGESCTACPVHSRPRAAEQLTLFDEPLTGKRGS